MEEIASGAFVKDIWAVSYQKPMFWENKVTAPFS